MKARLRVAMMGLLAFSTFAWTAAAVDVTGTWAGTITDRGNKYNFRFILKQDGVKVTGTVSGAPPHGEEQPIVEGKIEGDRITLKINMPSPDGHTVALAYEGKVNGNQMEGMASGPREGNLPFVVTKTAAADVGGTGSGQLTDRGGTFGPEKGWLVIDGGEEPVLPAIAQRFVSLAGGPEAKIVLVPSAMHDPTEEEVETYKKWLGAKNITVLNTCDRAGANSEAFVAPLRKATGVWFTPVAFADPVRQEWNLLLVPLRHQFDDGLKGPLGGIFGEAADEVAGFGSERVGPIVGAGDGAVPLQDLDDAHKRHLLVVAVRDYRLDSMAFV